MIEIYYKHILKKYGLDDWEIVISEGGWLCMIETKTIYLMNYDNFAMFLHEVAHAIIDVRRDIDKTGHDSIWGDKFTELVNAEMVLIGNNLDKIMMAVIKWVNEYERKEPMNTEIAFERLRDILNAEIMEVPPCDT